MSVHNLIAVSLAMALWNGLAHCQDKGTPQQIEMNSLRARAEVFLRRASPFGREQQNVFDITIAQYVAGAHWTDPDLFQKLTTLLNLFDPMPRLCDDVRDSHFREQIEILRGIHAEMRQGKPAQTATGANWRELLPPPNPPHYVERPMNDTERELLSLLKGALNGDIEQGLRRFDELYRGSDECAVPWDTKLGEAIHDFAAEVEYFEPKEEARRVSDIFYGPDELRERIRKLLAARPSEHGSE